MAAIYLHGDLQKFGGPFQFDVYSPADAVRALCVQIKGFRRRISEGNFRVVRKGAAGERDLSLETLSLRLRAGHELHIVPVAAGSGKGTAKIIIGVALVAASFAFAPAIVGALGPTLGMGSTAFSVLGSTVSFGQLAGIGAAMVLGGISGLLSPAPKSSSGSSGQPTNSSFLFNGPANVIDQGNPKPLVYGRFTVGSVVISSALTAEQI